MALSRRSNPSWIWRLVLALAAALLLFAVARALLLPTRPAALVAVPDINVDVAAAATHLAEAIRFETVAEDGAGPAGDAFHQFHAWMQHTYPAFHAAASRTVVGEGTLVYEWKGADASLPPVVLMAHQDVVPAVSPERWRHLPFAGVLEDGSVWGRGSIDNKGSLVALLEAAEAIARTQRPVRTVYLVFGHDEETRGAGAAAAAAMLAARGVHALFVLDEGSLVVADHPVARRAVALVGISEKGYATVRITAHSAGGHASMPPPDTAVHGLVQALQAISDRPFPRRYAGPVRQMLESLAPESTFTTRLAIANAWLLRPLLVRQISATPQGAAMLQTTLAPTMLAAGTRENVLATEASAVINLRITPGDTVEGVMAHLRASVAALPVELELLGESRDPSAVSSTESVGYALVAGAAQAVFGVPVAPSPVVAATDSRSMSALSSDIYRFQPLRLALEDTGLIHGIDERLGVDALGDMIRFYAAVLGGDAGFTASSAVTSPAQINDK